MLGRSQCLLTSAVFLLPYTENEAAKAYIKDIFKDVLSLDAEVWHRLLAAVKADRIALCDRHYPNAEMYMLPIRIAKILGWIGLNRVIGHLVPDIKGSDDKIQFQLASEIIKTYEASFAAVSDAQAPYLYIFVKACLLDGQNEMAANIVNSHYASLSENHGNITDADCDAARVLSYFGSIGVCGEKPRAWRPANPSSLLTVLLLCGDWLNLTASWNLRALDRTYAGFYVPHDYLDFHKAIIDNGTNYIRKVGFDFWNATAFSQEFKEITETVVPNASSHLSNEGRALCAVAALLFPDRLPIHLEFAFTSTT